jgi:hypothetical protein
MGRQDSRRVPLESPTEKPEPRPMRREHSVRGFVLSVTSGELATSTRVADGLFAARTWTNARAPHR